MMHKRADALTPGDVLFHTRALVTGVDAYQEIVMVEGLVFAPDTYGGTECRTYTRAYRPSDRFIISQSHQEPPF